MEYLLVQSIGEALDALSAAQGQGRIIAGGTDLFPDIQTNKYQPHCLVDISSVPELCQIRKENDTLIIGAAVTHTMASRSDLVRRFAPALAVACASVGSLQIRNVATLAGNVINAQPAADAAVALCALGAQFEIREAQGISCCAMSDMYQGFGKSALDSSRQLLAAIRVPCQQAGEGSAFVRLELRKNLALPMLNAAVMLHVDHNHVTWARIAMAPVGVGPVRAQAAEAWLKGKHLNEETIHAAAQLALQAANPRSNPLRGTREYRLQTLPVLISRALRQVAGQLAAHEST